MGFIMGYTSVDWEVSKAELPRISQTYHATHGMIEEIHFPRRDRRLHFPYFLTNARFDPGMSGGPILSATTPGVCGVICSGTELADSTTPTISYGSLIGPALAIDLEMTGSNDVTKRLFLWDLVRSGAVFCDETYAQLNVTRKDNAIEIDFGDSRIVRNKLREASIQGRGNGVARLDPLPIRSIAPPFSALSMALLAQTLLASVECQVVFQ
jgi:hypothetical protein